MKTALLHYWLTSMRGGENVLAEFCKMFPDGDIFTHCFAQQEVSEEFSRHHVTESFISSLPGARKNCQKYLPLMPLALKKFDLQGYDLILSSESGPIKGVQKPTGTKHICYCHTPMRYLYDMYDEYYRNTGLCGKIAMKLFRKYMQKYDLASADSVDHFIANSNFVANRIRNIYNRKSSVIYPPVDIEFFGGDSEVPKEDFYLFVGALIPYKQPELAIKACIKMNRKLVLVGNGSLKETLRKKYECESIIFADAPDKTLLRRYYASAKALLFPGIEDFGIVVVEAQAAGTPVIAYGAGGALETVSSDNSGLFFHDQTVEDLCAAVEEFESRRWQPETCRMNSEKFGIPRFHREIKQAIFNVTGIAL